MEARPNMDISMNEMLLLLALTASSIDKTFSPLAQGAQSHADLRAATNTGEATWYFLTDIELMSSTNKLGTVLT